MKFLTILALTFGISISALYIDILGGKFSSIQNIQGSQVQPPSINPFANLPFSTGFGNLSPPLPSNQEGNRGLPSFNQGLPEYDYSIFTKENLDNLLLTTSQGDAGLKDSTSDIFQRLAKARKSVNTPV